MARCQRTVTSPRFIAVDLEQLLLPGTFEHTLNYLVDHELDVKDFDARDKNDLTGASAHAPQEEYKGKDRTAGHASGLRQESALAVRRRDWTNLK